MGKPLQSFRRYLLDRMVLRPSRVHIPHGVQTRVMMDVCGRSLECFVQRNFDDDGPADLLVLKFPGTAGRAERSSMTPVSMLDGVRGEVWTWNPPGYGRSEGRASLQSIAIAAQHFFRNVVQAGSVVPGVIWLCGNSLGCNVALHVAATMDCGDASAGLVLRNPPPLIPVVMRIARQYPLGQRVRSIAESLSDEMNAMKTAPQVSLPAVFMQSEKDELVPPSIQDELIDCYAGDRRVVKLSGLKHAGIASPEQEALIEKEIRWLWNQTGKESPTCANQ
ncbi:alpha/beta hydrolase [Rubripirellula reticaptiva]|uniref:Alpha/beta hydrolase family protein n=1 Tax=Rubripirellula reticaptiva TaxID=2528013 RepID=A0A5C6F782_9BACT|nr:lysophospholipase [Rubripirellula reticaptiva]TWU55351.1 Alpha/beta hydrolase family protein [Rubripirellula reticaptiva]